MRVCRVCESADLAEPIELAEMMFQTGETFEYQQCKGCGCLQIVEQPADMSKHYPGDYYSFSFGGPSFRERVRDWLTIRGPRVLEGFHFYNRGDFRSVEGVSRSASIIDIGCGSGRLISALKAQGYRHLIGTDPFISEDQTLPNGIRILKRTIDQIEGRFDVVMMHHSLEHVWDQAETVRHIARLLAPGGKAIIRVPTIDSHAWRHYGPKWAQLDPPRHFYLHSRQSIRVLLERAGLRVERIVDDANEFGEIGSERASRGLSIVSADPLPEHVVRQAKRNAAILRRDQMGDQIAVHAA